MKKTNWLKLLGFALLLTVLVACSDNGGNDTSTSDDTPVVTDAPAGTIANADTDEPVADLEPVEIRIGTWDSGQGLEMKEQIAASFMAQHPHITVIIESVPDGFGERLLTQLAANDAPDLFQIGDGDVAMFQSRGAFADLTPFINGANPMNLDDFFGPMLEVGRIGDGIYTLPKDFSTMAVFYNRDIFDEAGIDYPTNDWTLEDFREIALALTTDERWGAQWMGGTRGAMPLIYMHGGDVIAPDGQTVLGYMDSEGTIAALEFLNQLTNVDRVIPSSVELQAFQGVNLFLSEQVAMTAHGIWSANQFVEAGMNFGTVMLPSGPAGQFGTVFYAGYGMWSGSQNQEEAWMFLNYLTTQGQHIMAQHALTAYIPASIAVGQPDIPHVGAFLDMVEVMRIFPERLNPAFNPTAGREFNAVLEEIQLTNDGSADIRTLLENAASRGQDEMEEEMRFMD